MHAQTANKVGQREGAAFSHQRAFFAPLIHGRCAASLCGGRTLAHCACVRFSPCWPCGIGAAPWRCVCVHASLPFVVPSLSTKEKKGRKRHATASVATAQREGPAICHVWDRCQGPAQQQQQQHNNRSLGVVVFL
nr:hypothetical protein [Pandoravirus massiliensis]